MSEKLIAGPCSQCGVALDKPEITMSIKTVLVYSFEIYNITTDQNEKSLRKATAEAIAIKNGTLMQDTEEEVDDTALDDNGFVI